MWCKTFPLCTLCFVVVEAEFLKRVPVGCVSDISWDCIRVYNNNDDDDKKSTITINNNK